MTGYFLRFLKWIVIRPLRVNIGYSSVGILVLIPFCKTILRPLDKYYQQLLVYMRSQIDNMNSRWVLIIARRVNDHYYKLCLGAEYHTEAKLVNVHIFDGLSKSYINERQYIYCWTWESCSSWNDYLKPQGLWDAFSIKNLKSVKLPNTW